jgi:hypothetical protein
MGFARWIDEIAPVGFNEIRNIFCLSATKLRFFFVDKIDGVGDGKNDKLKNKLIWFDLGNVFFPIGCFLESLVQHFQLRLSDCIHTPSSSSSWPKRCI